MSDDDADEKVDSGLSKKVQMTDVRYMMPDHMPGYLRVDKDVRTGLTRLGRLIKDYA